MEAPYKNYFDSMPCYLTVQNRNLKIIDANQKFIDDFGKYERRYCYQIYKHRPEKCEICPVEKTFSDGRSHSSLEQVRSLDERDISVIVYTTPIRDEYGNIISVMEMSTDITEVRLLERQLRDGLQRYQRLFEEVPCYISIQDHDLNIVDANRRFREDFGSFLGCKCYEIYKHRDEECIPCPVQETLKDGQVHRSEEVVTSREGEKLNVLVYSAPIHDAKGNIKSVMEMSTNITPIRELQSQLESTGILISSISHGIKGLLTGLDGGMYMVNTGLNKDNPQRLKKGWEMVQRNVNRIREMVMNLLYYAKEREPNWERISAANLGREVVNIIKSKVEDNGLVFRTDIPSQEIDLDADPNALRALLINLLENSIDACRVDSKCPDHELVLRVFKDKGNACFEIKDNGIGMDQETREKAFTLFFSSKGSEGTGLGLFIADKIARAHSGSIDLESEPDRGTRFLVRIPCNKQ